MVKVNSNLKYLRIAPRKVRLLADLIRGMGLKEARLQLSFEKKRASAPLLKLLNSAEANAKHNFKTEGDNLFISEIKVNEGPILKRRMPRARGRATLIRKRTSHVSVVLDEKNKKEDKNKKS